jgi:hypothetical protein
MSKRFDISAATVKEILSRQLGLKKHIRRCVPYELSEDHKTSRVFQSKMLLERLKSFKEHDFEGIATREESWFRYSTYSDSMFAVSPEDVGPRTKQDMSVKKQ